jgi:hypothetical protein
VEVHLAGRLWSKRNMTIFWALFICAAVALIVLNCGKEPQAAGLFLREYLTAWTFIPDRGCIPDSATAIRVAEAVWYSVYSNSIEDKRPFRAELFGDTLWVVAGSLPEGWEGGVPYLKILKKDGRILGMGHGK